MIVSILIGLTLILSTFISTVPIVQKIAYAQARMNPSNGVPMPNPVTSASTVAGRNSAVQGVAGALSSVHTTSAQHPIVRIISQIPALIKFIEHKCVDMPPEVCPIH
jgi:hypothetical protein